jgi:hypothetical protein
MDAQQWLIVSGMPMGFDFPVRSVAIVVLGLKVQSGSPKRKVA